MEHLFFSPSEADLGREATRILAASEVSDTPHDRLDLEQPVTWQRHKWLGFDHDEPHPGGTWVPFEHYAASRGWSIPRSQNLSIVDARQVANASSCRRMHPRLISESVSDLDAANVLLSLLQSWLLFGFLEDICQVSIKAGYLLHGTEAHDVFVDTRNLAFLLYAQKVKLSKMTYQERLDRMYAVQRTIDLCQDVVEELTLVEGNEVIPRSVDVTAAAKLEHFSAVIKNIMLLTMKVLEVTAYSFNKSRIDDSDIFLSSAPPLETLLPKEEMLREGFCRTFLQQKILGTLTAWHWLAWWGHTTGISRIEDHKGCSGTVCALENSPDIGPLHTSSCGREKCYNVAPDIPELLRALEEGNYPLMRIQIDETTGRISLDVVPTKDLSEKDYIAISHVWRHGLGSTAEVGLPACQISFIESLLCKFEHPTLIGDEQRVTLPMFWIDSLCIPSSPLHRKLAILGINAVFQDSPVLVIDRSIVSMRQDETSIESLLAAIIYSAWQSRLWTWLEAFFAGKLVIAMNDYNYTLRTNVSTLTDTSLRPTVPDHVGLMLGQTVAASDIANPTWTVQFRRRDLNNPDRDPFHAMLNFLRTMESRATTKEDDEALILATALGLNLEHIVSNKGQERMCAFYMALDEFPAPLLFLGLPCMKIQGFGWAPESLRLRKALLPEVHYPIPQILCEVTPEGLQGDFDIVLLRDQHQGVDPKRTYRLEAENGTSRLYGDIQRCDLRNRSEEARYWESLQVAHNMIILQDKLHDDDNLTGFRALLAWSRKVDERSPSAPAPLVCEILNIVDLTAGSLAALQDLQELDVAYFGEYRQGYPLWIL